jgi:chemotaxis protein CheY-P-specific phosphatase CheC
MKKIFTTKVSIQSSNSTHSYPIIRLPRELKTLAGRIASIYETEYEGEQAFFVVTKVDKLDKLVDKSENDAGISHFSA